MLCPLLLSYLLLLGKFRDLQRANIKAAATMLLKNYQLDDCITKVVRDPIQKVELKKVSVQSKRS